MTDTQLISRHAAGDDEAFADLVRRHGGWVYGIARRRTGDAHLAEDVTQAVFMVLARQAKRLRHNTLLPAWLFRVTQYASAKALRGESRRRRHETKAADMQTPPPEDNAEWTDLAPILDELVGRLRQSDREGILLRFYRQMPFAEVGTALGISEDAARKWVDRALAKLREMAQAKGLTMSAAALGTMLWTNMATEAAMPAGLVTTITTSALSTTSAATLSASTVSIAKGVTTMMAWTKAKVAAVFVGLALLAGGIGTGAVTQLMADDRSAPPHTNDAQRLQGHWRFVEVWDNGQMVPAADLEDAVLVLQGDLMSFRIGKDPDNDWRVTFDDAKDPKWLDLTTIDFDGEPTTRPGIYRFHGDQLEITINDTPIEELQVRPTRFASEQDSANQVYMRLRRHKPVELSLRSDQAAAQRGEFHWRIDRHQPVRLFYMEGVFVTADGELELRGGYGELAGADEPAGLLEIQGRFSTNDVDGAILQYRLWRSADPIPAIKTSDGNYPAGGVADGLRTNPMLREIGNEWVSLFESDLIRGGQRVGTWHFLVRIGGEEDPTAEPDLSKWLEDVRRQQGTEVRINDRGSSKQQVFLDFETGQVIDSPPGMMTDDEFLRWWRNTGIDVIADLTGPEPRLIGWDMEFLAIPNHVWNANDPLRLVSDELEKRTRTLAFPNPIPVAALLPRTYLFWTREGSLGILQIMGMNDQPLSVRMRYRILKPLSHEH